MLARLQRYFDEYVDREHRAGAADPEHDLKLATAALMIEVARADNSFGPRETTRIAALVREQFDLSAEETEALLDLAGDELDGATCLHGFTSLINEHWTAQDKTRIIEHMWEVAYIDAEINSHERHLLRKVAGLLYIPHKEYVAARMRAQETTRAGRHPE